MLEDDEKSAKFLFNETSKWNCKCKAEMRNRTQAFQKVQVGEWPEMSWKRGPGTGSQGWEWRAHFFRHWGTVVGLLGLK